MEPLLFLPPGCSPVTCRICNETIGANVNVVQYHFATTHAETTLPTYSVIFKSIQSIALSHVHTTGNVAVCQACQQPLKAVTVECISRHFRTNHDLKLSTTMVAEWLQQNSMQLTQTTNDVLDSATIPNEDHAETPATLGTPSLSVQLTDTGSALSIAWMQLHYNIRRAVKSYQFEHAFASNSFKPSKLATRRDASTCFLSCSNTGPLHQQASGHLRFFQHRFYSSNTKYHPYSSSECFVVNCFPCFSNSASVSKFRLQR